MSKNSVTVTTTNNRSGWPLDGAFASEKIFKTATHRTKEKPTKPLTEHMHENSRITNIKIAWGNYNRKSEQQSLWAQQFVHTTMAN